MIYSGQLQLLQITLEMTKKSTNIPSKENVGAYNKIIYSLKFLQTKTSNHIMHEKEIKTKGQEKRKLCT